MSRPPLVALVAAGKIRKSFLARIPSLAERLGPVASTSFRLASRIANALRAGHAVAGYDEFDACGLVLIRVPDSRLAGTVANLAASGVNWKGKSAILCETALDSASLEPLSRLGARVASLDSIPVLAALRLVIEGDRPAIREARAVVEHHGIRVLELRPGAKTLYNAGLWAAGGLFAPVIAAAAGCLKQAGIRPAPAGDIVAACVNRALRAYRKKGRRMLRPEELTGQIPESLRADPTVAEYLQAAAAAFSSLSPGRRR